MLQGRAADQKRQLRRTVLEPAIALFGALHMLPGNIQAMLAKDSRFDGQIAGRIARETSARAFQVTVHHGETNQTHAVLLYRRLICILRLVAANKPHWDVIPGGQLRMIDSPAPSGIEFTQIAGSRNAYQH